MTDPIRVDFHERVDIDQPIDVGWAICRVSPDRTTITRICKGCAVAVTTPFDPLTGRAGGIVPHAPWCRIMDAIESSARAPAPTGPVYADLADLAEDDRIATVGAHAQAGALVGFVVEDDAKADRYLTKLHARYRIRVVARGPGPIADSILVRIGPAES